MVKVLAVDKPINDLAIYPVDGHATVFRMLGMDLKGKAVTVCLLYAA